MGNCQTTEAETVVIVHPGKKVDRIFRPVSAREIMDSNHGHYVALVKCVLKSENILPVKQLKLLRPDDILLIGQVYRLISFEDVLQEFAAKRRVKLRRLLKENGVLGVEKRNDVSGDGPLLTPVSTSVKWKKVQNSRTKGAWKPRLKSISETEN